MASSQLFRIQSQDRAPRMKNCLSLRVLSGKMVNLNSTLTDTLPVVRQGKEMEKSARGERKRGRVSYSSRVKRVKFSEPIKRTGVFHERSSAILSDA